MTETQINFSDEYWILEALKLAQQAAEQGEVPIGALIVKDNQIIGKGYNQPINAIDPTAHAEIMAIREAAKNQQNYRLPGTTLYCTLEPCAMCAGAIIQARIERVVFAATDQRSGAVVSVVQLLEHPTLNHRASISYGILSEQAVKLLQDFFKQRR